MAGAGTGPAAALAGLGTGAAPAVLCAGTGEAVAVAGAVTEAVAAGWLLTGWQGAVRGSKGPWGVGRPGQRFLEWRFKTRPKTHLLVRLKTLRLNPRRASGLLRLSHSL